MMPFSANGSVRNISIITWVIILIIIIIIIIIIIMSKSEISFLAILGNLALAVINSL